MTRQYILLAAAIVLLAATVATTYHRQPKTDAEFMADAKRFMEAGPRNTAAHGMVLCGHINDLAIVLGEPEINCEKLYGGEKHELSATESR